MAAILAMVAVSCGRVRKQEPQGGDRSGGSAGAPIGSAGEGGAGDDGGSAGRSGGGTGGNAGRGGTSTTGGSAGSEAGGGRAGGGAGGGASGAGGRAAGAAGSSGAGALAGTAGAPSQPVPVPTPPLWDGPLPTDCERAYEDEGESQCSLSMQCGIGPVSVRCWGESGGPASCECETERGTIAPFALDAYSGIGTCRTVAQVCGSGEPVDLDGEEECTVLASSTQASRCDLHQSCWNVLSSGNAEVRVQRERSIACVTTPEDAVSCACGSGSLRFELDGDDAGTVCEDAIQRCDARGTPNASEPPACVLDLQSTFEGYCRADAVCTHTTDAGGGVTVLYDEARDVLCRGGAEPGSTCTCSVGTEHVTFRRDVVVSGIGDCNGYVESCAVDAFEPDGPPACEETDGYAEGDNCYSYLACSQPATFGGEAVAILGSLTTTCTATGGDWSCDCRSTSRKVTVDVADGDAAGACAEARTACPEAIAPTDWDGL